MEEKELSRWGGGAEREGDRVGLGERGVGERQTEEGWEGGREGETDRQIDRQTEMSNVLKLNA